MSSDVLFSSRQVYLPRNQLSAMRVSPKTPLAEVLDQICKDKNLDVSRYELRHPGE